MVKIFSYSGSILFMIMLVHSLGCRGRGDQQAYQPYQYRPGATTRWSSPENRNGIKGQGGKENDAAKGHAMDTIAPGATYVLLETEGTGIINRIWVTINDRTAPMLRALKIEMYWDHEKTPAVSVPFGDFFGIGLGRTTAFQNALFASPEGRSFNSFIQMPFKTAAKIVVVNESSRTLGNIFFDVDYMQLPQWEEQNLYFHAYWSRDTATTLAQDFEILPQVSGKGRFLGTNIGVNGNPAYGKSWFGEGEVKVYLDGDKQWPSLNGTGTEDYIGDGWGQGKFFNPYSGCSVSEDSLRLWAFYRYHLVDPIFFSDQCRVTIQQIGGDMTDSVAAYQARQAPLIPVSTSNEKFTPLYKKNSPVSLSHSGQPKGWTNFYRRDDVSATAYYYLDHPGGDFPALAPVAVRTAHLQGFSK